MSQHEKPPVTTSSNIPVETVYTRAPQHAEEFPGEFPFTRGIQPTMYRGRLWTMRQYAGMGDAEESNKRYKFLLANGTKGLSVAFDLPTQIGYDSDDPMALGEVGKVGVAIDSLEDMQRLFEGIPLDGVSTSMTINATASILLALYVAVARRTGANVKKLGGTVQNDILKEYIARGTYIYPVTHAMRIITDMFAWAQDEVPEWNTISISGYHMREAGSTAVQEIAFTLGDGIAYVQAAINAGLDVEQFAPRLSFFFNAHNNFLEEVAKFRAARRLWARIMRERFGAKSARAQQLRFHTQTAGSTLTAQQPENNIVRTAVQAMSAVLGGTQSLHTNGFDEALALPTEEAARIALRTQQIIAYESGVTQTVDPLGGSYFLENLTLAMENGAFDYFSKLDAMGGMVKAIDRGYPQKEIAEASYQYQRAAEAKEKVVVGVNEFVIEEQSPHILYIGETVAQQQTAKLKMLRARRPNQEVTRCLDALKKAAAQEPKIESSANGISAANTMPYIVDAVRAYCTVGEICEALRTVYGTYTEVSVT
jgi:methylmalonyl-CoA mutase N-terminal domain/subunit